MHRSTGAAESPLLSAKSGMNTLIEGGRDGKLTAKLQRLQGMAVKESASERALKTDFFAKVREFGHRLGLTHAMQVGGGGGDGGGGLFCCCWIDWTGRGCEQ